MDKDDKEIEGQLSLALCELDKAYEYIFKKEYCDAAVTIKMAKINLVKIKRILGYD